MSTPVTRKTENHTTKQNISLAREEDMKLFALRVKREVHYIKTICFHHAQ